MRGLLLLCLLDYSGRGIATIDPQQAILQRITEATHWFKVIPRPETFNYRSADEETKAFREWAWQFENYLSAVDEQFPVLLAAIKRNSKTEIVMENLTLENQVRSMKMYGLRHVAQLLS